MVVNMCMYLHILGWSLIKVGNVSLQAAYFVTLQLAKKIML